VCFFTSLLSSFPFPPLFCLVPFEETLRVGPMSFSPSDSSFLFAVCGHSHCRLPFSFFFDRPPPAPLSLCPEKTNELAIFFLFILLPLVWYPGPSLTATTFSLFSLRFFLLPFSAFFFSLLDRPRGFLNRSSCTAACVWAIFSFSPLSVLFPVVP